MKHLLHVFLLAVFSFIICSSQAAPAQQIIVGVTPIQTGFAVVTPVDGEGVGLRVSETFTQEVGGNVFRSSVLPSPLVTLTSLLIQSDPNTALNTGIAIVNPTPFVATLRLTLNNNDGFTVGLRTVRLEALRQTSLFVTELFPDVPVLSQPFAGLLFISADSPVGVVGLTFSGPFFTSLPVASQLIGTNVAVAGFDQANTVVATTTIVATTPVTTITPLVVPPPFLPSIIIPLPPMTQLPTPPANFPLTQSSVGIANPLGIPQPPVTGRIGFSSSQSSIGIANPLGTPTPSATVNNSSQSAVGIANPLVIPQTQQTVPSLGFPLIPPITGNGASLVGNTGASTVGVFTATMPEIGLGIGGPFSDLFAQVASGGGWTTTIVITNNADVGQFVRVDFFSAQGGPMSLPFGSSVTALFVPSGGVVAVSTN